MKTAIYAGSFDPVTYGHLDVLKSGAEIFDKVIIAVSRNIKKKGFLTVEERVELIKQAVSNIKNVEVASFDGLTVDFAKRNNAKFLLRGLRAVSDYEYEMQLSQTNQKLSPDIKTVFLITKPEYSFISSSTVREIYYNNGEISQFVPKCVEDYLKSKK
ncbi:pantetheine-phosphate adenylyltransferase [bacterium]|nr:pantetheine-phosphate adenylyltransferase [bacterium]